MSKVKYSVQFNILQDRVYESAYLSHYEENREKGVGVVRSEELAKAYAQAKLKAIIKNKKNNPLKYYCPNVPGEKVINAIIESEKVSKTPMILYSAANGIGKTELALQIVHNLVLGAKNGWFDSKLFNNFPYPKLIWYVTTPTVIESKVMVWINELFRAPQFESGDNSLRAISIKTSKEGSTHTKSIQYSNGWRMEFKTFDQAPNQFESADVGFIIIDEPCPQIIFNALKSRRRMGCVMFLPMTPLDIEPYVEEEIIDRVNNGEPGYYLIKGNAYDASNKLSLRGHLDHDIIESMRSDYDADEVSARIYGEPTHFSEKIYKKEFDEDKHIVSPDDYPIEGYRLIVQAVDPHDGRPSACTYCAYMPNGRKIFFTETPLDKSVPFWKQSRVQTIKEETRQWIEVEDYFGLKEQNIRRILDRHFGWQTRGGKTIAKLYADAGKEFGRKFLFYSSYKSNNEDNEITFGHKVVREALMNTLDDGKPEVVIWNTCYHTINGLKKYIRKRPTSVADMAKAVGGTIIVPKYKDFPDSFRYSICSNFKYQDNLASKREYLNNYGKKDNSEGYRRRA